MKRARLPMVIVETRNTVTGHVPVSVSRRRDLVTDKWVDREVRDALSDAAGYSVPHTVTVKGWTA